MLSSSIATLIRATRDELIAAGESLENATELADDSGFLASLGVYHEMHCLVRSHFSSQNGSIPQGPATANG